MYINFGILIPAIERFFFVFFYQIYKLLTNKIEGIRNPGRAEIVK